MVRHINQIHSKYMSRRMECAMMTIQEDQTWIFPHQHLHQIKIMSLAREFQIVFKKKFKYLIIFTFQITLKIWVAQHINNADVIVKLLQLVS
jgi:hypothetical protein